MIVNVLCWIGLGIMLIAIEIRLKRIENKIDAMNKPASSDDFIQFDLRQKLTDQAKEAVKFKPPKQPDENTQYETVTRDSLKNISLDYSGQKDGPGIESTDKNY